MPDDPKTTPPEPKTEPSAEEAEAKFWAKLETTLDGWFDRKVEKYRSTSTTRTGRTTLPGIMADIVFGKEKQS